MVTIIFPPFEPDLMIIWSGYLVSAPVNQFHDQIHIHVCFIAGLKRFPIIIEMQRLMQLGLSPNDKDYLRERARDGVCMTTNGHECFLGLIFLWKCNKNYQFFTLRCLIMLKIPKNPQKVFFLQKSVFFFGQKIIFLGQKLFLGNWFWG